MRITNARRRRNDIHTYRFARVGMLIELLHRSYGRRINDSDHLWRCCVIKQHRSSHHGTGHRFVCDRFFFCFYLF